MSVRLTGMPVEFGVLGPVSAWTGEGARINLRGPRHRAVLARLIVARRRLVPLDVLIDDLWPEAPPPDAAGAIRTFVAALRRELEPGRVPRTPAKLLVTEGPGYALHAEPDSVDAWRFETAVTAAARPNAEKLQEALNWWRGPAYADFPDDLWAHGERSRLSELRLRAVEQLATVRLDLGLADMVAADLDAHTAEHPWRENAWRLLALALYQSGRQADALAVVRQAKSMLAGQLGLDPGPALARLEASILRHDPQLLPAQVLAAKVWANATAAYDRAVAADARTRLESTVSILRGLAVTGGSGLRSAREHRVAAVTAAEQLGDPHLTARVIGAYDVPAIWSRVDDPDQAAHIVAAARRALISLPAGENDATRARLLATIGLETRGVLDPSAAAAAAQSVAIARNLNDPNVVVFALNALFMQSFGHCGLAAERDAIGSELIEVSARHGLTTYEVLGHLIRLQSRSALADFTAADGHAEAADALAQRHDLALVGVFTAWYRALRQGVPGAYLKAAALLDNAGMPGLSDGLLPMALLCLQVRHGQTVHLDESANWGPYEPWARPHLLLAQGLHAEAREAAQEIPPPPADHTQEALWALAGLAALRTGDRDLAARAYEALLPADGELAGAGTGLFTLGPVRDLLAELALGVA